MGALKLVRRSDTLVVSLDEAKRHMRRTDVGDDDVSILSYVKAATEWVEAWTGLALIDQTWDYYFDAFPASINGVNQPLLIPRSPLLEVLGLFYTDSAFVEVQDASFNVDYSHRPGRVYLTSGSWPSASGTQNVGRIRFRAGYIDEEGSPALSDESIPEAIRVAILIYAGTMFENREAFVTGTIASPLPWAAEQLLRQYRIETSIA